jgi:phosphatidylglycerol:prolipoprotein diacylglycerol transferase
LKLAIPYPSWLSPEIIPGLPFRWYGLMYLFAFATAYLLFMRQVKENKPAWSEDDVSGLFFWAILGLLVGARIFATIVYDTTGEYARQPWLVFWPYRDGQFVGLQGMSYHGGVIGATATIIAYSLKRKMGVRTVGDYMTAAIPLGYTFGRLGNFINGELYGRVTAGPLGMVFPYAERFPTHLPWVRRIAEQSGVAIGSQTLVNLPRHPSQLYEALFEGVVLWAILWALRNRKPFKGFIIGAYMVGYGVFRFAIEYFREPDADLGYRIRLVDDGVPPALFSSPFNFSTGQVLCALMIAGGIAWWLIAARLPQAEPSPAEKPSTAGKAADRKVRRKRRRMLK